MRYPITLLSPWPPVAGLDVRLQVGQVKHDPERSCLVRAEARAAAADGGQVKRDPEPSYG
ncbi:MAG: hypothetical protein NVSMB25_03620 [Thermoleophilaceae bacterium]